MKQFFTLILIVLCTVLCYNNKAYSQYPPTAKVWGASPFQDSLWSIDPVSWSVVNRIGPTLPGFTITGITGMAYDPCEFKTYVIMKVSGVSGRVLGTINLSTGVCTQVGNLGNNFSSLSFRKDGQLFGTTGNGANPNPESLFTIDKTTGATTLATALGNGADGEIICYNPNDEFFYHWSGNGTVIYEKFPSTAPYTPVTNIAITGTTGGETFGAMHWSADSMLISNISSQFKFVTTAGVYGNAINSLPDDLRGLVRPPQFALENATVCVNDLVNVGAAGVADYEMTYVWGDGNSDVVVAGSGSHTYTTPGTYNISVLMHLKTAGSCTAAQVYTTTVQVNGPIVALGNDITQCGGSVTLDAGNAGATYLWNNGATTQTITISSTGSVTRSVTVTDGNGCIGSDAINVTINTVPVVTLSGSTILCPGGSVLLTGTSGGTSQWYLNGVAIGGANSNTYTATAAGVYNMTKTNLNGCSDSAAVGKTVVAVNAPTVALGNDIAQCGGSVTLDAGNAGATFLWSNGATTQTITVSSDDTYSVTVTNGNGCTGTDAIAVTINTPPTVALGNDITQCGGTVTLDAGNAGATYLWNNGATTQTISFSTTGTVTRSVTVTDGNGCTGSDAINVTINTVPVVTLSGSTNLCSGGSVLLTGTSGGTSQWYLNGVAIGGANSNTYTATAPGVYNMTKTNLSGCSDSAAFGITVVAVNAPTVALGNDIAQCGGSVTLDAGNAGATFLWSNGATTQTITVSSDDTYSVTVTNGNGCTGSDAIVVTIYTPPTVALGNDITQCGGSVTLDAGNAGATYLWNNGATTQTITISSTGSVTRSVTVTDGNGCTGSDAINVTINTVPVVTISGSANLCPGGSVLLTGTSGGTSQWYQNGVAIGGANSNTYTATAAGVYNMTKTNLNGCSDSAAVGNTVVAVSAPAVALGNDVSQCDGTVMLDAGNAGASYLWSDGSTDQMITVSSSDTYSVTVTDGNGCTGTDAIDVTINTSPTVTFSLPFSAVCSGSGTVSLSGGSPANGTYSGTDVSGGDFTPVTEGTTTITYTYIDGNGCSGSATDDVTVSSCVGVNELSTGSVVVYPNPSSDIINVRISDVKGSAEMVITDIAGRKVEQWKEENISADYSHSFSLAKYGAGSYIIIVKTLNGMARYNVVVK